MSLDVTVEPAVEHEEAPGLVAAQAARARVADDPPRGQAREGGGHAPRICLEPAAHRHAEAVLAPREHRPRDARAQPLPEQELAGAVGLAQRVGVQGEGE